MEKITIDREDYKIIVPENVSFFALQNVGTALLGISDRLFRNDIDTRARVGVKLIEKGQTTNE
jgi:hypothetical protein